MYISEFLDFSLSSPVVKLQVFELKIPSLVFKLWDFDGWLLFRLANTAAAMSTIILDIFFGVNVNMGVQTNLPSAF